MSQENVEMVSRWVAAMNRQDAEELILLAHPEVDYMPYLASLAGEDGSYKGHDGLRRYVEDLIEAWSWYHVEIQSLRDLGDQVLMEGRLEATGKSSGLEVREDMAWLHTFVRGTGPGRYKRLQFFADRAKALEAAGVPD